MATIKTLFAALALSLTSVVVAAPVATAQGTATVVIDQGRIMRDSRGGKDIIQKMKNIEASMKAELEPIARSLESEGKSIEARTKNMTREQMAADAALRSQVEAYAKKAQDFNVRRQRTAQELQLTERKAWGELFQAMEPVLQEVVREKSAGVILDRSEVVYANPALDATSLVISKLDSRKPTVNVSRQRLPSQ